MDTVAAVAVEAAADTVAVAAVEAAVVVAAAATERAILTAVNLVAEITNQVRVQAKATKVARNLPAVTPRKAAASVAEKRTESLFF